MKEKYNHDPRNSVRVIVTIQNGTDITTSHLWMNKQMLGDVYREQGIKGFRQKVLESLDQQNEWASQEIQEKLGFIGGPVGGEKKSWWRWW